MGDLLTNTARCIGETRDVGAGWLVAASPKPDRPVAEGVDWITAMRAAMTADSWRRNASALNDLAMKARTAGLAFAYHNHPIEFARYDGERGIDILLAHTDPLLVKWELDVAWAAAGGDDSVALLRDHRTRIRLLHAKGLKVKPAPGHYGTTFATGIIGREDAIDWRAVFTAARGIVEHVYIEQESPHRVPAQIALALCRDELRAM